MTFDFANVTDHENRVEFPFTPANPEPGCEYAVEIYSDTVAAIVDRGEGIVNPCEFSTEDERVMWAALDNWAKEVFSRWFNIPYTPNCCQWSQLQLQNFFELAYLACKQSHDDEGEDEE